MSTGRMDTRSERVREAQSEPEVPTETIKSTDSKDEAVIAAELLSHTGTASVRIAGSRSRHSSASVEHAVHSLAERAERYTRDAFDASREAFGYIRWSMEQAQQARTEAARAREHYDELLSISSRHREYPRANRRGAEDDVNASLQAAMDTHRGPTDYESRHDHTVPNEAILRHL